jgi:hypothetical protein
MLFLDSLARRLHVPYLPPNQVTGNRNDLQETYPGELTVGEV